MTSHQSSQEDPVLGDATRRLVEELAECFPLSFLTGSEGEVLWASEAWPAQLQVSAADPRAPVSALCRHSELRRALARARENGGLLRFRAAPPCPGADAGLDLTFFRLAPDAEGDARTVAVARRAGAAAPDAALLDAFPAAVLTVDAGGFVERANAEAVELLGFGAEVLEGLALPGLAVDTAGALALLDALQRGARASLDLDVRDAKGRALPTRLELAPRRGEGGAMLLTLRRERMRGSQNDLQRRNEELEHCVNTLAHDLRSPLVALLGFSRLLRNDYGERMDDTARHFLDRIEQAGRTMESLIHDMLELSRIGNPGEHPRLVDPRAVLLQLAAELKPRLDEADIRLDLPGNPPLIYCDRTRLYQVFSNLIGNAIDHMGSCEDRRIEVEIIEEPTRHHVSVRDFGQGIEPALHGRIFDAFQSPGVRPDGTRGTGMGLAIVRKIAETHGGRAWVESQPGEGACFHVTLPRS